MGWVDERMIEWPVEIHPLEHETHLLDRAKARHACKKVTAAFKPVLQACSACHPMLCLLCTWQPTAVGQQ